MWPFLPYGVFHITILSDAWEWKTDGAALSDDLDPTRILQGTMPDVPTE